MCPPPLQFTAEESLFTLLDNRTWGKQGIPEDYDYIGHSNAWLHPQVNVFVTLVLFIVMKVGVGPGGLMSNLDVGAQIRMPSFFVYYSSFRSREEAERTSGRFVSVSLI